MSDVYSVILLGAVFLLAGLVLLVFLARAELRSEGARRKPWHVGVEYWVMERLERLLEQPPSWARLRPLAGACALGALVGLVFWVLWTHGAEWLSAVNTTPPPPRPSIHSGLPIESVVKQIAHGLSSMAPLLFIMSILIAGYHAIVGERTEASGCRLRKLVPLSCDAYPRLGRGPVRANSSRGERADTG